MVTNFAVKSTKDWDTERSLREFWRLFQSPEGLVEVRILEDVGEKDDKMWIGRFTNEDTFVSEIQQFIPKTTIKAFYCMLNPVSPQSRWDHKKHALNTMHPRIQSATNADIVKRQWLLIDLDPEKPEVKMNSTDAEHQASVNVAFAVYQDLKDRGWPEPCLADSGNGTHLLYRIDLPNNPESDDIVRKVLSALKAQFTKDKVSGIKVNVDQKVGNVGRISKIYGTPTRKGTNTPERPQRTARWLAIPESLEVVPEHLLRKLAMESPEERRIFASASNLRRNGDLPSWNKDDSSFEQWLREHGVQWRAKNQYAGGTRWELECCVWNSQHTDHSAMVLRLPDGRLAANCFHNSCDGKKWPEFRAVVEPGYTDRRLRAQLKAKRQSPWDVDDFVLIQSLIKDMVDSPDYTTRAKSSKILLTVFEMHALRLPEDAIRDVEAVAPEDLHPLLRQLWAHARRTR